MANLYRQLMNRFLIPAITVATLALTACTYIAERIPGVYTIDIQQGNILNQEVVDQLRPNMNKRQVLYILGTPMLRDVFHQKRWDYIFSDQPGGEDRVQKRLSLYFEGDSLIGIQGDFRPSSVPVLRPSHEVTIDIPERQVNKTLSEKVVDLFTFSDTTLPVKAEQVENEGIDTDVMSVDEEADSDDINSQTITPETPSNQTAPPENTDNDEINTGEEANSAESNAETITPETPSNQPDSPATVETTPENPPTQSASPENEKATMETPDVGKLTTNEEADTKSETTTPENTPPLPVSSETNEATTKDDNQRPEATESKQ